MPNRIEEIQTAMAQQGAYQGEPSGKWDGATSDALRSYQERSGLPPTGKLDAASLQHLGLGSDVAGLNPPKAVLPAAAPAGNATGPTK
jgi:peptidoglycan hydrolase-like protein with peptidoglycan-binding domain